MKHGISRDVSIFAFEIGRIGGRALPL